MWHFYFLRKNIWQTCLFLPNSIKLGREQKDLSARFSDKTERVFLGKFSLFALKMSAVPLYCSLYGILQSPCGSRREEVEHVFSPSATQIYPPIWIASNSQNVAMDTSTYWPELFSSLIFTTAQVVFITAKITFIFTSLSPVQIYDFHIFTVASSQWRTNARDVSLLTLYGLPMYVFNLDINILICCPFWTSIHLTIAAKQTLWFLLSGNFLYRTGR